MANLRSATLASTTIIGKIVTDRLTIPGTPIYLDLPALFAELD